MPGLILVVVLIVFPTLGIVRFSVGEQSSSGFTSGGASLASYFQLLTDGYYVQIILRSFGIAAVTTVLSLFMALPTAYFMSRSAPRLKAFLMIVILFPLLAGAVVQSIGWVTLLSPSGLLSQFLQRLGLIDSSLQVMQTPGTLIVIMALIDLPFIVLSVQGSLDLIVEGQERAALSLGATRLRAFRSVILPQMMPGIVTGTTLAFVITVNAYSAPRLIGGDSIQLASPEIYAIVTLDGNWPLGSALSIIVVALSLTIGGLYSLLMSRRFDKWRAEKR